MDVLGDLVARDRRTDATALRAPADLRREYDYRRFCTNAWKVGNFLHHLGVRAGVGIGVADEPVPEPVLTFYGAALLGAPVQFLGGDATLPEDTRAVVVRAGRELDYHLPPGGQRVVYGDAPADPSVAHFERDVWSQNPTQPPDRVTPDTPALRTGDATYSHAALLAAARTVADEWGLDPTHTVAVRASLTEPGTVAAGLVAPVLAGASILLPDAGSTGDVAVGNGPEERTIAPDDLL